jgi:MSHA biogenesis protein MshP
MMPLRRQRGFSLPTAIFVMIILLLVGGYMMSISSVQHSSTALSIEGARAYYAARSGFEWAAAQATASQASHDAICGAGGTTTVFTVPAGTGAIGGFTLSVTCDDITAGQFREANLLYEMDHISVVATRGGVPGNSDYVSRTLQGTVTTAAPLP